MLIPPNPKPVSDSVQATPNLKLSYFVATAFDQAAQYGAACIAEERNDASRGESPPAPNDCFNYELLRAVVADDAVLLDGGHAAYAAQRRGELGIHRFEFELRLRLATRLGVAAAVAQYLNAVDYPFAEGLPWLSLLDDPHGLVLPVRLKDQLAVLAEAASVLAALGPNDEIPQIVSDAESLALALHAALLEFHRWHAPRYTAKHRAAAAKVPA